MIINPKLVKVQSNLFLGLFSKSEMIKNYIYIILYFIETSND